MCVPYYYQTEQLLNHHGRERHRDPVDSTARDLIACAVHLVACKPRPTACR